MTKISEFNRLLGQRIKEMIPVQTFWVVCKSVDWENKTMTAIGQTDDLEYEEVSLGNGSIFRKPVVDTICLLGITENNGAIVFLIDADEVEEYLIVEKTGFKVCLNASGLTLNGENLGGIVKADELKAQVDKNTKILERIQQAFQNWTPVAQDGGAALKGQAGLFVNLERADLSNIKNDTIKHGDGDG